MQIFTITKGATSVILPISIFDSSSTTGAKLAGLVFNTASLTAYYNRSGAAGAAVAITLATATKGTWATGGFIAIDGTNMPGDYELHIPDAALATGANTVLLQLKGAANMVPKNIQINLTSADLQNSTTLGLTNLDAAVSSRMATYTQPAGFLAATFPATVSSPTNITAATGIVLSGVTHTGAVIPTVTNLTNLPTIPANWLTAAGIAAAALNGKGDWNIGKTGYTLTQSFPANFADLAITVTTGRVTVGTNGDKTGYSLSSPQAFDVTGNRTGNVSGSVGSVSGAVGSVTGAVGSVTGAVGSVTARVTANTDQINGSGTSANRLQKSTVAIAFCTVGAASTTSSIVTSAMDPAAAVIDQFKGKIVSFASDTTTANLRGQSTDITASTALGVLTVTPLSTAPVSGDTFVIT